MRRPPLQQVRRFSKEIEEGDLVVSGRGRNAGTVRVIRDRHVVATVHHSRDGGGWLYND